MKLKNKKTGEIEEFEDITKVFKFIGNQNTYNSLAELNEEWEDVPEEPKGSALDLMILTLTNFIENEPDEDKVDLEDCKQMLEKLKAWKRLKDKGFKFNGWEIDQKKHLGVITIKTEPYYSFEFDDLDLLFGGEV